MIRSRLTPALALAAMAASCSDEQRVTQPLPTTPTGPMFATVWGYVLDRQDKCLVDAVVRIVDSSDRTLIGRESRQSRCDFDSGLGFDLASVVSGTRLTMQASGVGYRSTT